MINPVIKFFGVRVNVPGEGPAVLNFPTESDLSDAICNFHGTGAPSSSTLYNGRDNYIVGDLYTDTTNKNLWTCTTAGTNAVGSTDGSAWVQISGGGGLKVRGEWDGTQASGVYATQYSLNDVVVISLGINQGTFVWIGDSPGNSPPYTGGQNWMQLPGGLLGQWM